MQGCRPRANAFTRETLQEQQLNNTALARIGQRAARDFKERVTAGVKERLTAAAGGGYRSVCSSGADGDVCVSLVLKCFYTQTLSHWETVQNTETLSARNKKMRLMILQGFFQLLSHIFKTLPIFFSQNFTHKSKNCTQNAKHLTSLKHYIQNITNTSQKQTSANTFAIILIPVRFVC